MIEIAENLQTEISKIQDAENDTRNIQAKFIETDDVQTVEQVQLVGFESNPPVGTKHLVKDLGGGWKQSFAENDGVAPDATLLAGESKIYSSDGGAATAFIILRKDGNIELNGSADNAVSFAALKTEFDKFKDEVNAFITKYNGHGHLYTPGTLTPATSAPTLDQGVDATADITPAKVATVKLP